MLLFIYLFDHSAYICYYNLNITYVFVYMNWITCMYIKIIGTFL
jgi:hypothetical protein